MGVAGHSEIAEAARLWLARDEALDEPRLRLDDLVPLDEALRGHVARIRDVPRMAEPGEVFVGVLVGRTDAALEAAARSPALFRGLESALGWMDAARMPLSRLPARAVVAGCAVHRVDPGRLLEDSLASPDVLLRARAVKAVWQLGRRDLVPRIREAYRAADIRCRFSACWAGALLANDGAAVAGLRELAQTGERYPDRAVQLACARMDPEDARAWLARLPLPLQCLGRASVGRAEDALWLAERGAADGVHAITGGGVDQVGAWAGRPGRFLLGRELSPGWLWRVLRVARMPHRPVAATELAMLTGEAPFEFRAPAFRQLRSLEGAPPS